MSALRGVPGARVSGIAAGLHALVELPPGQSEADAIARAARRGVAVQGLASYTAAADRTPHSPALLAGYACPPPHAFATAIARLCAALDPAAGKDLSF